jgi:hypothetical protein
MKANLRWVSKESSFGESRKLTVSLNRFCLASLSRASF